MPEEQKKSLFREKSIERASSPESLNDYIRVTTTPVWLVLVALLVLLAGIIVWGVIGRVDKTLENGEVKEVHPIEYVIN
ncbi:MAG: hypothetical protein K5655_04935 [Lachnospiraceae bacterium]|nr:hypothetical protein [Lachnospiraceae bacterium]